MGNRLWSLSQQIARWLYQQTDPDDQPIAGVRFASRHGDDLALWALFERAPDATTAKQLEDTTAEPLHVSDPDLVHARRIHRLTWAE